MLDSIYQMTLNYFEIEIATRRQMIKQINKGADAT